MDQKYCICNHLALILAINILLAAGISYDIDACFADFIDNPIAEFIERDVNGCYEINVDSIITIQNKPFSLVEESTVAVKKLFFYNETTMFYYRSLLHTDIFPWSIRFTQSSAVWLPEQNMYLVVARLTNLFTSLIYASLFDEYWNEITTPTQFGAILLPSILPIPSAKLSTYLKQEDMRVFKMNNGDVFGVFHMIEKKNIRRMWLFGFTTGKIYKLDISNSEQAPVEKNWSPLVIGNSIYMVYNHQGLQVLDCTNYESGCLSLTGKLNPNLGEIHGGSPYVRFADTDYYISFGYSIFKFIHTKCNIQECLMYRPVLTIIKADIKDPSYLNFKLIYTSELLDFGDLLFDFSITGQKYFNNNGNCFHSQILTIGSIAKWDYEYDEIDITANINDKITAAIRIKGVTKVVKAVINRDLTYQHNYHEGCPLKKLDTYIKNRKL
jgi:hypothetical protein